MFSNFLVLILVIVLPWILIGVYFISLEFLSFLDHVMIIVFKISLILLFLTALCDAYLQSLLIIEDCDDRCIWLK